MKTFKIKVHSSVDLITNSSTVIFTYSEESLDAVKDLVNEMLKVFGKTETFNDIFYAEVFAGDEYIYTDSENYSKEIDLGQLMDDILSEKIEKPQWMKDVESDTSVYDYTPSTSLYLKAKDEKYSELANQLLKYLYSTDHEATRDG